MPASLKSYKLQRFMQGQPLLDQITADRLNAILDAIEANRPIFGTNIQGTATPNGTIIRAKPQAPTQQQPPEISFAFKRQSGVDEDDNPVLQVLIKDGKINGEFPDGMGFGEYALTIPDGAGDIWAGVTFDPDTLEITSRFLDSGTFPEPPDFGTFYIYLGFAFLDGGGKFQVHNTYVGDINFELVYGAFNGQPAILPVQVFAPWTVVPPPEDE